MGRQSRTSRERKSRRRPGLMTIGLLTFMFVFLAVLLTPPSKQLETAIARPDNGPPPRYCSEARARGIAPIYAGSTAYTSRLDGDGDGIACERW